ncbi:MAG: DUF58 domain-containing protein [Lentisphaeria bacterium]|nr:DUF58 domain-containing protein [Lentisphaeria bacterium]
MAEKHYHYLPAETLDSLKNIELIARSMVEGSMTGLHRSPYHGFSSEFSEHRKYCPGDAVRHVDWQVYGKTDRYYVKQYEEETNTRSYVVLDTSASMSLGKDKHHKLNYACYLSAAFIYLMQRQKDAVGLFTYSDKVDNYFPARTTRLHMLSLLSHLETITPSGQSRAAGCFHRIAEEVQRRSIVIIFSDFFDMEEDFIKSLQHFQYKDCEVILFQVLDTLEHDFPYKGLIEFKDLETSEIIEVESDDVRNFYLNDLKKYVDDMKLICNRMNISYETLSTGTAFEKALLAYFHKRERMF